jgi:hypothetical protein
MEHDRTDGGECDASGKQLYTYSARIVKWPVNPSCSTVRRHWKSVGVEERVGGIAGSEMTDRGVALDHTEAFIRSRPCND